MPPSATVMSYRSKPIQSRSGGQHCGPSPLSSKRLSFSRFIPHKARSCASLMKRIAAGQDARIVLVRRVRLAIEMPSHMRSSPSMMPTMAPLAMCGFSVVCSAAHSCSYVADSVTQPVLLPNLSSGEWQCTPSKALARGTA